MREVAADSVCSRPIGDDSDMGLTESIEAAKWLMVEGRDVPWLLRTQAELRPGAPFLIWEPFTGDPQTWTYAEFAADVQRVAGGLSRRGVSLGDRVMIHLDNSPEFMLSWFACAELGAIAVSTNTRSVGRDLAYFASHTEPAAIITSPEFVSLLRQSAPNVGVFIVTSTDAGQPPATRSEAADDVAAVRFDDLLTGDAAAPERPTNAAADLGIQFTSGTTSRPKAVLWTHANVIWAAEVSVGHMRLRTDDVTLTFLPLFHTNAQSYSMLSTLWSGGTMVLQPRFSASRFWDVSVRHRVTWCSMVPFCLKAIVNAGPVPTDHSYRFWGPAVRLPEIEDAMGIDTIGWWGMTETVTQGILGSFQQPAPRMSIGRPSAAFDISVRRLDGSSIGPGERGDLFIRGVRGVQLFKEYYGNPEATAAAFDADGWFATGDVISMDAHGDLFFSDRSKDMLKVGAENVAASEIEAVIVATGLVDECAVVGQPHDMLDEVAVAFVILCADAGDRTVEESIGLIMEACHRDLAAFKVPRAVYVTDDLPRSTLEKVAKNKLREGLSTLAD